MCRGGPRELRGYGDLRVRARAGGRGLGVGNVGATNAAVQVRALAPSAACSLEPRRRVTALRGKAVPHRSLTMSSRWTVETLTDVCVHGAPGCCGGARIDSPRAKVCTMIIAAPHCRQMKVGFNAAASRPTSAHSVPGSWISRAEDTAPSSSRERARLTVRLPLDNKP